jgi:tetratricopeptide (TPR) repeat protein
MVGERKSSKQSSLRVALSLVLILEGTPSFTWSQQIERSELGVRSARAAAATERRDFAEAEVEWLRVIALDPRSAPAFYNLGLVYYLEYKYPEAEAKLRRALEYDPSFANARVLLGASLVRQARIKEAIPELERTLKSRLDPAAERTARLALYDALFIRGDYGRAVEVLKPLAAKYPNDTDLLYDLGEAYLQLAAESLERIAEIDPLSYRAHQLLAESLGKQGRYQEAIREYQDALQKKPDLPGVHYEIGLLYRVYENNPAGDEQALHEFEAELKINPFHAGSEYRLGRIYWKKQDVGQAVAHFGRAVELDEALVSARLALARALEARGDLREAQKQLEIALRLEPQNAAGHYRMAQLYKRQGNQSAAARELREFDRIQAASQTARTKTGKASLGQAESDTDIEDDRKP